MQLCYHGVNMLPQIARVSQHQAAKAAQEPQSSGTAPGEAPAVGTREPGYIATLKDNYGFITCAPAFVAAHVGRWLCQGRYAALPLRLPGPCAICTQPNAALVAHVQTCDGATTRGAALAEPVMLLPSARCSTLGKDVRAGAPTARRGCSSTSARRGSPRQQSRRARR